VNHPSATNVIPDFKFEPALGRIPPGEFWMGSTDTDDKFASRLEQPRHRVTFSKPFAIGIYPVTFDEWDAYARDMPSAHDPDDLGRGRGSHPVVNVSWNDAAGYLAWLKQTTGKPFRLPSEAEWEYACRAGTTTVFNTGNTITVDQANYLYTDFRQRPGLCKPVPVGSYLPNAFGLFDIHGNVAELVADSWFDDYSNAPTDGSPCINSDTRWRVVRGGGWDAMPRILRSAFRDWIDPDQRLDNTGFRVACDVE